MEDILDKYSVSCTDYIIEKRETIVRTLSLELEGRLEDAEKDYKNISEVSRPIGKRVYNKEGGDLVQLIIKADVVNLRNLRKLSKTLDK